MLFDRIYRNSDISRSPNSWHIGQREFLAITKPPCELGWSTAGHAAVPLSRPARPGLSRPLGIGEFLGGRRVRGLLGSWFGLFHVLFEKRSGLFRGLS